MRIKKYEANTMREAIAKVKHDFGSEGIILHSKDIKKGGIFGFFGKNMVEVMAGIDINILEHTPSKPAGKPLVSALPKVTVKPPATAIDTSPAETPVPDHLTLESPADSEISKIEPSTAPLASAATPASNTASVKPLQHRRPTQLETKINSIADGINQLLFRIGHHNTPAAYPLAGLDTLYAGLVECGLSKESIDRLFLSLFDHFTGKDLKDSDKVQAFISHTITNQITVRSALELASGQTTFLVFVGPTGVGKTTTIAKLAAQLKLFQGKKVGFITIDTYRIAAIEQLKTFAEIIEVPVEVVYTAAELAAAKERLGHLDIVLIDTAGRSPFNKDHMVELKEFLAIDRAFSTYLVLSLNAKLEDTTHAIREFETVGFDFLILSKLDETNTLGNILDIVQRTDKPIVYLTTGQNVPDDLEAANATTITSRILAPLKRTFETHYHRDADSAEELLVQLDFERV